MGLRLFIAEREDRDPFVCSDEDVEEAGYKPEDLSNAYGSAGRWWEIVLHPVTVELCQRIEDAANARAAREIDRSATPAEAVAALARIITEARFELAVAAWPEGWRWKTREETPRPVMDAIDHDLHARIDPAAIRERNARALSRLLEKVRRNKAETGATVPEEGEKP